jgi:arabinose-5-phosphate isomerase
MADRSRHFQSTPGTEVSDCHASVREILEIEAAAVSRAAERLDARQVEKAVGLIEHCRGKVVVIGVGKSGVIAQKIAQTLASTGTVAMFLHPSDALHGGLGVVLSEDVVIVLSNSGETDELLAILPILKHRGVSIVSIAGNVDSTLARHADAVIDASVDREACPLNLAPTASTTVALAIGDAIAMTVMARKGLSQDGFAANHPAGQLGKRLTLRVADVMHPSPNISPDAGWLDVIQAISKHTLGAVNVVDSDGRLIGIVTDGDVRRTIERTDAAQLSVVTANSMMTRSPVTTSRETLAYDALKLMEERPSQISVLPVVDDEGRCVGLLRVHDIIRSGI